MHSANYIMGDDKDQKDFKKKGKKLSFVSSKEGLQGNENRGEVKSNRFVWGNYGKGEEKRKIGETVGSTRKTRRKGLVDLKSAFDSGGQGVPSDTEGEEVERVRVRKKPESFAEGFEKRGG